MESILQGGTGSESSSMTQPDVWPDKFESGTINAPGIIGLGAGIEYIMEKGIDRIRKHEEELTRHFIEGVKDIEGIKLYGPLTKNQAPVIALNLEDLDSSELSYILDEEYDIAVRPGLHCAPLAHKTLNTLNQGAVRFSFGMFNKHEEVELAIKALDEIARRF